MAPYMEEQCPPPILIKGALMFNPSPQVMTAITLQRRLEIDDITVSSIDPGLVGVNALLLFFPFTLSPSLFPSLLLGCH